MLQDRFGRRIDYVRLSVTDRCDLRCNYCIPKGFKDFEEPSHWLTFDEIERVIGAFARLGTRRVRLTGGEPLLRRGVTELAARLSALPGLDDLSLSTNATQLARHAQALKAAGVSRLNVSLDSLRRDCMTEVTGRDSLPQILDGLMAAKAAVIYGVARLAKSSHADALERAVLMAQGGEFAFVLFSAAASQGVISGTVNANMTAIVVLSMALTPLFLIIHGRFSRKSGINLEGVESLNGDKALRGNVLIIGFGRVGQIASQAPIAYGAQISIIDNNPDIIRQADKDGFKVYYGDGAREDILHAAGAENADCILICIDDAHATTRIVEIAKHVCPNTRLIVRAFDREHAFELVKAQADFFVRETFEAAMSIGNEAVKMLGADESQSAEICERVRRIDKERFALEVAGDTFAGRALLLKNAPPKAPH